MKYLVYGWIVFCLILSAWLGPIGTVLLMVGLYLIWLYYKPKRETMIDFWHKYGGFYYMSALLCLIRFRIFVAIFMLLGLVIEYMLKISNK